MAYVRKSDRAPVNNTGIEGIEQFLTSEELTYCNNLASIRLS